MRTYKANIRVVIEEQECIADAIKNIWHVLNDGLMAYNSDDRPEFIITNIQEATDDRQTQRNAPPPRRR